MNQLPEIAQIGDSILKTQAKPVGKILDSTIVELIDCLIKTAIANKGVGIAAPQIAQSYRLFIIASHPSDRYPHAPAMKPMALSLIHI